MLIGPWQERDLLRCCRDVLGWTANDCHKRLVDELLGLEPPDEPPPYQILKHHLLWSNAFEIALQGDVFVQPKPRNLRPPQ